MPSYHQDFYTWTQEQAALLKAGRFMELDVANLIEEVEDMGNNKRSALKSRLTVLMMRLLKWHYQPSYRGRSWLLTITEQRFEIADLLDENPGLKSEITELLKKAFKMARLKAANETGLDLNVFPLICPWDFKTLISEDFYPD